MTQSELYRFVKAAIFATPACADGEVVVRGGMSCPSCVSEFVADRLVHEGHINLSDPWD